MLRKFGLIALVGLLWACDQNDDLENPCSETSIEVTILQTVDSPCGEQVGQISATASGGTGLLQYSINGINFQDTGNFDELAPGKYQVLVRDAAGCEGSVSTVLVSGVLFGQEVEGLIESTCAITSCHVTGAQAPDLSLRSNIFTAAPRILTQLNAGLMPPKDAGVDPLAMDDAQKIKCWVEEGAPDN